VACLLLPPLPSFFLELAAVVILDVVVRDTEVIEKTTNEKVAQGINEILTVINIFV